MPMGQFSENQPIYLGMNLNYLKESCPPQKIMAYPAGKKIDPVVPQEKILVNYRLPKKKIIKTKFSERAPAPADY